MPTRKAKPGSATAMSLKNKDDNTRVQMIEELTASPLPGDDVWDPTEAEVKQLQTQIDNGNVSDEQLKQYKDKFDVIYDAVPPVIYYCRS